MAAAGIVTIIQTVVSAEDLLQWGWRIPFLIAGPLGLIGLYLRLRLEETPAFQMMEQAEERSLADESTGKNYAKLSSTTGVRLFCASSWWPRTTSLTTACSATCRRI